MYESSESIFLAFLLITWNLICISDNTVTIHLHRLQWHDDCLLLFFAYMKNDQTGPRKRHPQHVCANPIHYKLCPELVLAVYLVKYALFTNKMLTQSFPRELTICQI